MVDVYWRVGSILIDNILSQQGAFPNLVRELQLQDPDGYRNFLRIDATTFEYLTGEIAAKIQIKKTNWRSCIAPDQRLAITLRYLATGNI